MPRKSSTQSATSVLPKRSPPILLIGSLLSPFVRRIAIVLQLLEVEFQHVNQSAQFPCTSNGSNDGYLDEPILVRKDGRALRESPSIVRYARTLSDNAWRNAQIQHVHRAKRTLVGNLGLFIMEHAVALTDELRKQPGDSHELSLKGRTANYVRYSLILLDNQLETIKWDFSRKPPDIDLVTCAVAWTYCQEALYYLASEEELPRLSSLCEDAERLKEFALAEHGHTPYPVVNPATLR